MLANMRSSQHGQDLLPLTYILVSYHASRSVSGNGTYISKSVISSIFIFRKLDLTDRLVSAGCVENRCILI
jgi:hypothetical protein